MDRENPLVSVIVRTKDRPGFLKTALGSIAAQNYRPIEVILINDGGCDLDIDSVRNVLNDVPLNYIRFTKSKGRAAAGNAGILNAKGKYAGFLDDDDEFCRDHLTTIVSFLEKSDYRVAYADSELVIREFSPAVGDTEIKERKVFSSYDFSYVDLLVGNYIPLISILFSTEVLKKAGGFDESFELYEDWDLLLRIGWDYPFYHINKVTSLYNQWSGSLQIAQSAESHVIKTTSSRIINKHLERINPEVILNLKQKEEALTADLKDLIERYTELSQKNIELSERNSELSQKNIELSQKNMEISALRDENASFRTQIREMQSTLGWRFLIKLRVIRNKLLPAGTGRWKVYQKAVESIKKVGVENTPGQRM